MGTDNGVVALTNTWKCGILLLQQKNGARQQQNVKTD